MSICNAEQCLETCVEHVAEQTLGNLELVLIDDGPSEATPNMFAHSAARPLLMQTGQFRSAGRRTAAHKHKTSVYLFTSIPQAPQIWCSPVGC